MKRNRGKAKGAERSRVGDRIRSVFAWARLPKGFDKRLGHQLEFVAIVSGIAIALLCVIALLFPTQPDIRSAVQQFRQSGLSEIVQSAQGDRRVGQGAIESDAPNLILKQRPDVAKEIVSRAYLKGVIYYGEGMYPNARGLNPYKTLVAYVSMDDIGKDYSDHPRYLVHFTLADGTESAADTAGACQFLSTTWDSLHRLYPDIWFKDIPAFAPLNQDLACLVNFARTGGYKVLMEGWGVNESGHIWVDVEKWTQAVHLSCGQWISLPCDASGANADPKQPVKDIVDLWHNFLSTLEEEEAMIVPRPATPLSEQTIVPIASASRVPEDSFPSDLKGIAQAGDVVGGIPLISPRGWRIHPVLGTKRFHKGDDWGTEIGTPLFAPVEGRVKCYQQPEGAGTYGRFFPDAWGDREWMVAHLSVCEDGHYHPKEVWGKTGNSGALTTGPHAHFEFWTPLDGKWADRDVPKGWWWAFATGDLPKS